MPNIQIWCDRCSRVFFTKPIQYDMQDEYLFIEQIKQAYREHRMSDECRGMMLPIARDYLDYPF